jgi:ribosome recycling factor
MSYQEIIDKIKPELDELKEDFKTQLREIRASRLAPSLLEDIKIDCFGQELPLKQLGIITVSSAKEIHIQLWDNSYAESVVSAIEKKNLGLGIKVEGRDIYLSFPPLTQESKQNLIKLLSEKREKIYQEMRRLRDKIWRELQDKSKEGEISEDDKYKGKDKLEEMIREFREELDKLVEEKRKEIES